MKVKLNFLCFSGASGSRKGICPDCSAKQKGGRRLKQKGGGRLDQKEDNRFVG